MIEDDINEKRLFIEAFKEINNYFKYTIAFSDKDAWNKLKILKHLPDLIFIDIDKPGINGFEFLNRIKADELFNQIPVIVISASDKVAEKAYKSGAESFILKPVTANSLHSEIEYVFNLIKEIV